MSYKLIIFDFDGTLADSFAWLAGSINQVADKYRFRRIDPGQVEAFRGLPAGQIIRQLGVPFWKVPFIARHLRALMAQDIGRIRLFPGVDRMLARLAERGLVLGVVSSNSLANVRAVLGPAPAARIAHYACGAAVSGKTAHLKKLLEAAGVRPAEAFSIGDEIRDIEAARAAGIPCGAVTWGYTRGEALRAHAPDEVFGRMGEIVDKLT
jgi:phosphoglycolate phosphatase